jgi:hypothetical protein
MRRVRVGLFIKGVEMFYQREEEYRDTKIGKWIARPYFVSKGEAVTMSEEIGIILVQRLRALKQTPFMEDARDGSRIELASEAQPQSGEDNRQTMLTTLDGVNSYLVRPICRPSGRCWFLKIIVPGISQPQVIYADDPIAVLQRAQDMNFLQFAERFERPQPPAAPVQNSNGRRRPGDIWN